MIGFFPDIYEDELVYSWFSRYHVKSGQLSMAYTLEELYVHPYTTPDIEFINELKPDTFRIVERCCSMDDIIQNHTMFPAYGRFLPINRKREAYAALYSMHGNFNNLLAIPKNQEKKGRFLKYCPLCAAEDRKKYGETYWHRKHQISGLQTCALHSCYLCESEIPITKKSAPGFRDAESAIDGKEEPCICEAEKQLSLAVYLYTVFDADVDMDGNVHASDFLKLHLKNYHRSDSGASFNLEKMYGDYREFCLELSQMDVSGGSFETADDSFKIHLQKLLNGTRWNFFEVCRLAMFAGISPDELTTIPSDIADTLKKPVFLQVSEELGLDYELVQKIGNAVLKRYECRMQVQRRKRGFAWEKMDAELLPKVRETIRLLQGNEVARPQRVTVSSVTKAMQLPEKRMEKLPRCREEIKRNQETQKEYWAREVTWAYRKLLRENQPVNWKHIRVLTNMRKIDFQGCKPYLYCYAGEDAEVLENLI